MSYKKQKVKLGSRRPTSKILLKLRKMSDRLKLRRRRNITIPRPNNSELI